MGEIRNYICGCGYHEELYTGIGLNGRNMHMISHFFPEEAEKFRQKKEEKLISTYVLANVLAACPNCNKLVIVPGFTYQRRDESFADCFMKDCADCDSEVFAVLNTEKVPCPKCGAVMDYKITGDWD